MMNKYIFCINSGRSGSNYLAHIFNNCEGCVSFHEPLPRMNGIAMYQWLKGNKNPLIHLMPHKIKDIEERSGNMVYIETNHCFIKGFGWHIPAYFKEQEIAVIILKRDAESVANSLQINNASPFSIVGRDWLILPTAKNCLINPNQYVKRARLMFYFCKYIYRIVSTIKKYFEVEIKLPSFIKQCELMFLEWYYDELHMRGESFKKRFPNIKYFTIHINLLNEKDKVDKLLKELGIKPRESLNELLGKARNKTLERESSLS